MVSGFTEQFIIAPVDVSLAAQNAMVAVESMGIGGVFIGGIRNDPEKICELLKIPDHVYPVFGMCLGYPDEQQEQKPRLPVNVVLKEDLLLSKDLKSALNIEYRGHMINNKKLKMYRNFLKDSIRKKINFRFTDQNQGIPVPPIEKTTEMTQN